MRRSKVEGVLKSFSSGGRASSYEGWPSPKRLAIELFPPNTGVGAEPQFHRRCEPHF